MTFGFSVMIVLMAAKDSLVKGGKWDVPENKI